MNITECRVSMRVRVCRSGHIFFGLYGIITSIGAVSVGVKFECDMEVMGDKAPEMRMDPEHLEKAGKAQQKKKIKPTGSPLGDKNSDIITIRVGRETAGLIILALESAEVVGERMQKMRALAQLIKTAMKGE